MLEGVPLKTDWIIDFGEAYYCAIAEAVEFINGNGIL